MDWRGVVLENWPYKIAALVLGVLLWVNVAVEEPSERGLDVEVDWVVPDSDYVLVEAPRRVEAVFQGPGSEILTVATASTPRIRHVLDSVAAGARTVRLSPDSVQYPRAPGVRVTGVRPSEARLVLERRARARLPVRPDLRVSPAPGYRAVGPPEVEPDTVTVLGAESEVRSLIELTTVHEELVGVRGTRRVDLTVQVPEGLGTLEVRPQIVLATVRVDTVVERSYRLPVSDTSGLLDEGLVAVPDSVSVSVRGPESVVRSLAEGALRAVLEASPPTQAGRSVPVRVALPDTTLSASVDPRRVELRRPGGP